MHPNHIRLVAIDPLDAKILLERGRATLVDVREEDEWRNERIEGALLNPLSDFDVARIEAHGDAQVILYCHGGARSPKAADLLFHAGHLDLMHLRGGLTGWKLAGLETLSGAELHILAENRHQPSLTRPPSGRPDRGRAENVGATHPSTVNSPGRSTS